VPVSSVTAVARFALDGVPRKVATPVPSEVIPVPPFVAASVPAIVMVPLDVIGPPDVVRPVVPPDTSMLVTEPTSGALSTVPESVRPVPSVISSKSPAPLADPRPSRTDAAEDCCMRSYVTPLSATLSVTSAASVPPPLSPVPAIMARVDATNAPLSSGA
jgi:hypothetical protein